MNFYKFHLGDYYKKTSHLTLLEDGAYRRLMDAIYLREAPLPRDKKQIYRLVKVTTKAEKAAVDSVLGEFFTLSDEGYTNARCDEELNDVRQKSAKAAESARTRWSNANASPIAMRSHSEGYASHKPLANKEEERGAREVLTKGHRVLVLDLLDKGKAQLNGWERSFLEGLLGKVEMTAKAKTHLDAIANKIGITASDTMAKWESRLNAARKHSQWDVKWGPLPGQLGCIVPDQLLKPGDGQGWAIWHPGDPIGTPPQQAAAS